jgi:hypothetical protein
MLMGDDGPAVSARAGALRAIFWGGLLCGVFDIAYAFAEWAIRGVAPIRILQGIASGILGPSAFRGGTTTAALGLALHFLIAFTAAGVYYSASQILSFMKRQAVTAGLLYGIAVYCFMHYVVIPLSATRKRPFDFWFDSFEIVEHMLLVGLPIALATRKFAANPRVLRSNAEKSAAKAEASTAFLA